MDEHPRRSRSYKIPRGLGGFENNLIFNGTKGITKQHTVLRKYFYTTLSTGYASLVINRTYANIVNSSVRTSFITDNNYPYTNAGIVIVNVPN